MDLPIKGQEVLLSLTSPLQGLVSSIAHVKDATATFMLDIIQEQYLGQDSDQFDDIFRGMKLEFSIDCSNPKTFDFVTEIINRAQRRTAASQKFNATMALKFPNGQRRRLLFPDLKWGEVPFAIGKRDQYGEKKFTANCSTFRKL